MRDSTAQQWDDRVLPEATRKELNRASFAGVFAPWFIAVWVLLLVLSAVEWGVTHGHARAASTPVVSEENAFWNIFAGREPQDASAASRAAVAMLKQVGGRAYLNSLGANSPLMSDALVDPTLNPSDAPYSDFEADTGYTIVDISDIFNTPNSFDTTFLNDLRLYQEYGIGRVLKHTHTFDKPFPYSTVNGWWFLFWWLIIGQLAFVCASLCIQGGDRWGLPSREANDSRFLWLFAPIWMAVAIAYCSREQWRPALAALPQRWKDHLRTRAIQHANPDTAGDVHWAQSQLALLRRLPVQSPGVVEAIETLEKLVTQAGNVVPEQMSQQDGEDMAAAIHADAQDRLQLLQTMVEARRNASPQ